MLVLGINLSPHDRSIAIVKDGEVICAIEEERITREKHGFTYRDEFYTLEKDAEYFDGNFLNVSSQWLEKKVQIMLDYLYEATKLAWDDFDMVVCSNLYPNLALRDKVLFINHHLAHAANTFYLSDFKEAAIMIADGCGSYSDGSFETVSFYQGLGKKITPIKKYTGSIKSYQGQPNNSLIGLFQSLGALYKNISVLVGCGSRGEGKMMGLASYGEANFRYLVSPDIICTDADFQIDNQAIYLRVRDFIATLPEFSFQIKADLARSCQEVFNDTFLQLSQNLHQLSLSQNICVAGGCFLNAITNSFLLKNSPFKQLFVPSSPGDNGVAVGAALYGYFQCAESQRKRLQNIAYWGKQYTQVEIVAALEESQKSITYTHHDNICQVTADLLANGKVLAWFQASSEFGPRALGNRSILASPLRADMKDYLNNEIKFRENYRPVAPAILQEYVDTFFKAPLLSRSFELMTLVLEAKPVAFEKIPATVHVDGTARVQIVSAESNARFYQLITEFYKITGVPIVINTSFNLKDEPIVETPKEAIQTFLRSHLDYLVIADYLVSRS